MASKNGVPLVLFSGGLDSTYLVSRLLQDGPVDILYVNGGQSQEKMKMELEAREKLIEKFNTYYPYKIHGQYEIHDPVYLHTGEDKKWTQPNAWMQGAFRILAERHSELNIAYVNSDGCFFGSHLPEIKKQWKSMLKVGYKHGHVPLKFPLLANDKLEILEWIDKRLLKDVWVCELPVDGKACQKCNPCMLINNVLLQYKQKHGETVWNTTKRVEREYAADLTFKRSTEGQAYVLKGDHIWNYYSGTPRRICKRNKEDISNDIICDGQLLKGDNEISDT